jgi:hypothetical protein
MLLAELEVWHTRPRAPTRRVALGHLILPADPAPGFGGLLLGAVIAANIGEVDADLVPDVHRLIRQVEDGDRIVQPRLRHRFQIDRHGLGRSLHQLHAAGEELRFQFDATGSSLAMVLGAVYAVERLAPSSRRVIAPLLHQAMRWSGPVGPALISHLAGTSSVPMSALADPRAWAMEILGFPVGSPTPTKRELTAQFRNRMRSVHPDHGGDRAEAAKAMHDLATARRILSEARR